MPIVFPAWFNTKDYKNQKDLPAHYSKSQHLKTIT